MDQFESDVIVLCPERFDMQVQFYSADHRDVAPELHPFATFISRLTDQQAADRGGQGLAVRRLAVLVYNGINHYDAAIVAN